ncbi:hypothetical protein, partial [Actinoalloteichus caeruleus]|uniref:hypothetical protein n=1 Tax=Actinoalloteichus cyanogriseus TaxID=2893586 RepID=UPI001B803809
RRRSPRLPSSRPSYRTVLLPLARPENAARVSGEPEGRPAGTTSGAPRCSRRSRRLGSGR